MSWSEQRCHCKTTLLQGSQVADVDFVKLKQELFVFFWVYVASIVIWMRFFVDVQQKTYMSDLSQCI